MILPATDDDILEMGKLAILASQPMGMGFLEHQPHLRKDDIALEIRSGRLSIDYYLGRMVKFHAYKEPSGWEVTDQIRGDYQSWIHQYPSYTALYAAACVGKAGH